MKNIAIVGGGASGVLAAIHILRASEKPLVITMYEPNELGAGLAYGTTAPEHILNVPADRMSCDERDPEDFVDWLECFAPQVFTQATYPFVSRMLFKKYLQTRLQEAQKNHIVEWVKEKAIRVHGVGVQWRVETSSTIKDFDYCVVATGYERNMMIPSGIANASLGIVKNPYDDEVSLKNCSAVAIIGTGLTAIDIWRSLRQKNFLGKVHFVSRRGQFPQRFSIEKDFSLEKLPQHLSSPQDFLKFARETIKAHALDGGVFAQALRPYIVDIWSQWSPRQKKQFLNHLRPYWDSIRHRLPDSVHKDLQLELESEKCTVHASYDFKIKNEQPPYQLQITKKKTVVVDKIFVATGALLELHPFVVNEDVFVHCPLNQGFVETKPNMSLIGPPTRTTFWESTAVPEIRRHAQNIAQAIKLKQNNIPSITI